MNETIKAQLNHRTIRAFKDQELTDEQKEDFGRSGTSHVDKHVFAAVLDDARYG